MQALLQKYRRRGLIVDTNLLVLLVVGLLSPHHLPNCRATKSFTEEDFDLLHRFVSQFEKLVTTPHILTEVSNLAGRLPEPLHHEFRIVFRSLIERLSEKNLSAETIASAETFLRFGLTDTGITLIEPGTYLVLTSEIALYGLLQKQGVDAINFNHIRMHAWS